jgi:hypothetical protein
MGYAFGESSYDFLEMTAPIGFRVHSAPFKCFPHDGFTLGSAAQVAEPVAQPGEGNHRVSRISPVCISECHFRQLWLARKPFALPDANCFEASLGALPDAIIYEAGVLGLSPGDMLCNCKPSRLELGPVAQQSLRLS